MKPKIAAVALALSVALPCLAMPGIAMAASVPQMSLSPAMQNVQTPVAMTGDATPQSKLQPARMAQTVPAKTIKPAEHIRPIDDGGSWWDNTGNFQQLRTNTAAQTRMCKTSPSGHLQPCPPTKQPSKKQPPKKYPSPPVQPLYGL